MRPPSSLPGGRYVVLAGEAGGGFSAQWFAPILRVTRAATPLDWEMSLWPKSRGRTGAGRRWQFLWHDPQWRHRRSRDRFSADHRAGGTVSPGGDANQPRAESDPEHGGWRAVSAAVQFKLGFEQLGHPGRRRHRRQSDAQHHRLRHERPRCIWRQSGTDLNSVEIRAWAGGGAVGERVNGAVARMFVWTAWKVWPKVTDR